MSDIEFKVVYYFNDTSDPVKCEGQVCQTMEGWYDDYPDRPHGGNCDCEITPYIGYGYIVYKNFEEVDGGETTHESERSDTYENPHPTEDMEVTITISYEVTKSVEVSVAEVMTHFGVSGSAESTETMTREINVTIPPLNRAHVEITISGTVTHYNAEKWIVFEADDWGFYDHPDGGEIHLEDVEGGVMYESGNDVDVEIVLEPL